MIKFNKDVDYKKMIPNIKELFDGLNEIEGINEIIIKDNCIDRENRYHLLIQIDMEKEILDVYDNSLVHKTWKENYSNLIEKKAIFDYDD